MFCALQAKISGEHLQDHWSSGPVKVSSLRDFEVLSRDLIRILSHAEIFSFAALNCLQSGNMDSRVFMEHLNPCLWHSWTPCPWPLYRLSA